MAWRTVERRRAARQCGCNAPGKGAGAGLLPAWGPLAALELPPTCDAAAVVALAAVVGVVVGVMSVSVTLLVTVPLAVTVVDFAILPVVRVIEVL
jgi:hypothetical protein